jgi:isopenicillin-N epimerase
MWILDPDVTFLNHGSFGACPRPVLDAQQRLREELEAEPVRFLSRELESRAALAREALGAFIGADPDDLAFVPNATTGVNTVLRSLRFAAGDEIVATDHGYNACLNAAEVVAAAAGARVVVARVPFPLTAESDVTDAVMALVTPRTRLALLDHITSPTGLVFPLSRLVADLAARGVDALVDGAHAPGMVPLDLRALGAAYYTGNGHKWICAPKGAAFLYVRRDRQAGVRPLVISHGANSARQDRSRFRLEFDWMGTQDPTPYLALPEAIRVVGAALSGGWPAVMARNRALALVARARLAQVLGVPLPCPDSMIGSLAALPLPDGGPPQPLAPSPGHHPASLPDRTRPLTRDPVQQALFEQHRIEVPVMPWPAAPRRLLRISAQLYNEIGDYERLACALPSVLEPCDTGAGR